MRLTGLLKGSCQSITTQPLYDSFKRLNMYILYHIVMLTKRKKKKNIFSGSCICYSVSKWVATMIFWLNMSTCIRMFALMGYVVILLLLMGYLDFNELKRA